MENHLHTIVELLLAILIASTLVLTLMDLYNRVSALFNSKEAQIQQLANELQEARNHLSNLEAQVAQNNTQELSNFLAERGF